MRIENPFHEGELLMQQRAGDPERGRRMGRAISGSLPPGAGMFLEKQPLAVIGSVADDESVWTSALTGTPGFLRAPDEHTLVVDISQLGSSRQDPFCKNIRDDPKVGALVIDLGTRHRLRINGRISLLTREVLRLEVKESFPNCPKYIQRRLLTVTNLDDASPGGELRTGRSLDLAQQDLLRSADIFFVSSAHPDRGVDTSHRGGHPGFVTILDERTIRIPDYAGNHMFSTLGNFMANPRAGLLFFDFDRARTLQLTGRPEIRFDLDDPGHETGGTRRYWDFESQSWLESGLLHHLRWEFLDSSPHNPRPTLES